MSLVCQRWHILSCCYNRFWPWLTWYNQLFKSVPKNFENFLIYPPDTHFPHSFDGFIVLIWETFNTNFVLYSSLVSVLFLDCTNYKIFCVEEKTHFSFLFFVLAIILSVCQFKSHAELLENPTQVFFCEYCEIFSNSFFIEHLWWLLPLVLRMHLYSGFFMLTKLGWDEATFI